MPRTIAKATATDAQPARAVRGPGRQPIAPRRPPRAPARTASCRAAPTRCPTTSCSNWCCSAPFRAATPRSSPSGCIARFGSFAEVINAPEPRLKEVHGVGDRVVEELKLVRAAALRLMQRADHREAGCSTSWTQVHRVSAAPRMAYETARAVPHPVPRQEEPADRRRGAGRRHRRPHAGLRARGGEARAGAVGDRDHPRPQSPLRRSRRRRAPTST